MAKVQIISPIKVIKSGTAPTTSNLSEGEMAVGEVTDNYQDGIVNPPRIFFRAGNKIYDPIGKVREIASEALIGVESLNEMVGTANGIAQLDDSGKVPSAQLPSYVDDVLEFDNKDAFPNTGESGKIYIAIDTNKSYRWGGTTYVEISSSLALGTTSSTAFPGDRGAAAETKAQSAVQTVALSASTSNDGTDILLQTYTQGASGSTVKETKSISIPAASVESAGIMTVGDFNALAFLRTQVNHLSTGINNNARVAPGGVVFNGSFADPDRQVEEEDEAFSIPFLKSSYATWGLITKDEYTQLMALLTNAITEVELVVNEI